MKTIVIAAMFVVIALTASARPRKAGTTYRGTYTSYNPSDGKFDLSQKFIYLLPNASKFGNGPYPLFVWVPGTDEVYNDPLSLQFINGMVGRGYMAASVQYSNTNLSAQRCTDYTPRAQGIFDSTRTTSATSVLCLNPHAACSKKIAVSGVSQGGAIAIMAKNYDMRVSAVYALSMGDYNVLAHIDLTSCLGDTVTAIAPDSLRIVNGSADPSFGSQSSTQGASGVMCADGSTFCFSPANGGWYLVQNSEVMDGTADHCYFDVGGCNDKFDPNWLPPSLFPWSLDTNLNWLAQ